MGCKSKNETPAIDVIGHIKADLRKLDSTPYSFLKITEKSSGQADSAYIKKSDVWQLITPFLSDEIQQDNLTAQYTESSYADATIQSVMITYQAKEKDAVIHQVAVYINPVNGQISRLHMTGLFDYDKWAGKKQLWWMGQQSFSIISTPVGDSTGSETVTEKIIWQ